MLDMIDATKTIESVAANCAPETAKFQKDLGDEIAGLWSAHLNAKNAARATNKELRAIRAMLGEQLCRMKDVLAKPGRDGQWSGFLREHRIPRATADRLVACHERFLNPDANRPIEADSEPTEDEVKKIFTSVWRKLRRTLRSRQSLLLFIDLLTSQFKFYEATDREILVLAPPATTSPASPDGFSIS
jgi:hypothetical protein